MVLRFGTKFEVTMMMKDFHDFYLKYKVLLLVDVFKQLWVMTQSLFECTRFKLECNV